MVEQKLDFLTVQGCDVEQVFTCHTGVGGNKCVVSTCESEVLPYLFNNAHTLMTAMRLGSVLRLQLPVWAEAMVAAATVDGVCGF